MSVLPTSSTSTVDAAAQLGTGSAADGGVLSRRALQGSDSRTGSARMLNCTLGLDCPSLIKNNYNWFKYTAYCNDYKGALYPNIHAAYAACNSTALVQRCLGVYSMGSCKEAVYLKAELDTYYTCFAPSTKELDTRRSSTGSCVLLNKNHVPQQANEAAGVRLRRDCRPADQTKVENVKKYLDQCTLQHTQKRCENQEGKCKWKMREKDYWLTCGFTTFESDDDMCLEVRYRFYFMFCFMFLFCGSLRFAFIKWEEKQYMERRKREVGGSSSLDRAVASRSFEMD